MAATPGSGPASISPAGPSHTTTSPAAYPVPPSPDVIAQFLQRLADDDRKEGLAYTESRHLQGKRIVSGLQAFTMEYVEQLQGVGPLIRELTDQIARLKSENNRLQYDRERREPDLREAMDELEVAQNKLIAAQDRIERLILPAFTTEPRHDEGDVMERALAKLCDLGFAP